MNNNNNKKPEHVAEPSIVNVIDITDKFKAKLFHLKTDPTLSMSSGEQTELHRKALKSISYLTNMYFYTNVCRMGLYLIEYKTQSGDDINNFSISNLN